MLAALRDRKNITILVLSALLLVSVIWPPRLNRYQVVNAGNRVIYRVDRLTGEVYWIAGTRARKVVGLEPLGHYTPEDIAPGPQIDFVPDQPPAARPPWIVVVVVLAGLLLAALLVIAQVRKPKIRRGP